jgi:hypothetical protein
MTIKSYTFKQIEKMKSFTNWDLEKEQEVNMTDPDAPDAIELIEKGLARRMESPFVVGADGEIVRYTAEQRKALEK